MARQPGIFYPQVQAPVPFSDLFVAPSVPGDAAALTLIVRPILPLPFFDRGYLNDITPAIDLRFGVPSDDAAALTNFVLPVLPLPFFSRAFLSDIQIFDDLFISAVEPPIGMLQRLGAGR